MVDGRLTGGRRHQHGLAGNRAQECAKHDRESPPLIGNRNIGGEYLGYRGDELAPTERFLQETDVGVAVKQILVLM
jgi:hypothetical protein